MDLIAALSVLTGDELYNLVTKLRSASLECLTRSCERKIVDARREYYKTMMTEALSLQTDALMQIARIPIPLGEAAAVIRRDSLRRHHPQKVAGT